MLRKMTISPAYDKTKEGYGIHGVEMRWVLMGTEGAVQFLLYTNWYLPENRYDLPDSLSRPLPADLGYHSRKPMYEGHTPISDSCEYLGGAPCYYDGSGLAAEAVFETLVREGDEGLWKYLETYYAETFTDDE